MSIIVSDPYISLVGRRLDQGWSSSLREDSWENLERLAWMFPTRSTSRSSIFDGVSDSGHADLLRVSESTVDAHGNLFEIRRLTGLNWTSLADLLNVDRRTIHNWVKGGRIRKVNRHHVAETLKVLRFADRGSAELNAAGLDAPSESGLTALGLVKAAQYANARNTLGRGVSRPFAAAQESDAGLRTGTFRSIITHDGADGSETIEPLPDEPMPRSQKRRLERG
ncbi:MAG: hypothetical protein OXP09_16885 [Gammaproteobacteria bacterium]|nr:hypothetical protein [Gammaproteobacteria bacterium]